MILAMSKDIRVVLIKLADRTAQHAHPEISAAGEPERESHRRRWTFTRRWRIVLAYITIKQELEDLSPALSRSGGDIQNLVVKVGMKRAEREENIRTVIDTLSDKLKEMNIHYEIDGRPEAFLQHIPQDGASSTSRLSRFLI